MEPQNKQTDQMTSNDLQLESAEVTQFLRMPLVLPHGRPTGLQVAEEGADADDGHVFSLPLLFRECANYVQ